MLKTVKLFKRSQCFSTILKSKYTCHTQEKDLEKPNGKYVKKLIVTFGHTEPQ